MADEFVNIGFSDITNVVLNNVKPERWEIGVRLVTYKQVKSIIDVVDDNNLPSSKITDSLATLLGNYIYNKVQKVSNFRKKIVSRFVTRYAKDVEKLNSLVLELADKSPDSDVIGPFCTKLSITKTVLDIYLDKLLKAGSNNKSGGTEALSSFLNADYIFPQTQSVLINNADIESNILDSSASSFSDSFNSSNYVSSLTNQIDDLLLQNKNLEEKVHNLWECLKEENASWMSAQFELKDITLQNEKIYKTTEKCLHLSKFKPRNFTKRLNRQILQNNKNQCNSDM